VADQELVEATNGLLKDAKRMADLQNVRYQTVIDAMGVMELGRLANAVERVGDLIEGSIR
jgi:hypothetical protein